MVSPFFCSVSRTDFNLFLAKDTGALKSEYVDAPGITIPQASDSHYNPSLDSVYSVEYFIY